MWGVRICEQKKYGASCTLYWRWFYIFTTMPISLHSMTMPCVDQWLHRNANIGCCDVISLSLKGRTVRKKHRNYCLVDNITLRCPALAVMCAGCRSARLLFRCTKRRGKSFANVSRNGRRGNESLTKRESRTPRSRRILKMRLDSRTELIKNWRKMWVVCSFRRVSHSVMSIVVKFPYRQVKGFF